MASSQRYLSTHLGSLSRARTGGPRPRPTQYERQENVRTSTIQGSHMPLDTDAHWTWRNPLNILPAMLIFFLLIGIAGTVIALF